jgi:proton-coupled amino acid transporter
MLLLVKCRKRLERQGITGIKGYGDVGREVMGPWGEVLVNVCLVISQAGFATAYLIFIGANIQKVTNGMASRALIIYACVPLLSLLVQFRNMKTLSPFSLIADVANVLGFSCVLFQDFEYYTHDDNIEAVDFRGLIYVTSVCIYSLEGVGLILPLESSCADREGFPRLLKQTITGITILMAVFGTCGYVAFGNQTISPISLNLKGESAAFVQVALCLALYLTYPIMMFPVSDVLENLFLSDSSKPPRRYCPSRTVRVMIVLVTATIAYSLPNFGKFLELVGASICTLLGFILPCYFHLRVFGRKEMKMWELLFNLFIIVVAVFFAFVGTIEAIMKLLEDDDEVIEGNLEL